MGQQSGPILTSLTGRIVFDQVNAQILIYDENNLVRVLIGQLPDGTYGMVASTPGNSVYDIFT